MAVTVAFRFPLGRYHATPWNRSVNEGAAEWPPSPWRVLRALVATWYTRWPDLPAPELDALLEALSDPPSYRTPVAAAGHTRHYLPDLDHKKGETGGTDLTLDPFLSVRRQDKLLVRWDADLSAERRQVLAKLAELMPYLGRADSVCEAQLLDDDPEPDETWWIPGGSGARQVRLLTPARPVSRPALEVTTVQVRKSRRTVPVGAAWVSYTTSQPVGLPTSGPARQRARKVQAARFFVTSRAPLKATHGILLADAVHRIAASRLAAAEVCDERRQMILGSGGVASNHQHAHWIPIADGSERGASVVALVLWVPGGLAPEEVASTVTIRKVSGKLGEYQIPGFPDVELMFQAAGTIEQVAPELCGRARQWRSRTPYLPVRHRKREMLAEFLAGDVAAELGYRGLPPAVARQLDPGGGMPDRWGREFRRYRRTERMDKSRPGLGLRLEFAEEIQGPLLLGQLSHFGYGIFEPES